MTLADKLRMVQEAGGSRVYFFRRGIFWVLYDQSVYLYSLLHLPLIENARYKITRSIDEGVITLFLPVPLVQQLHTNLGLKEEREGILYHELAEVADLVGYEAWKQKNFPRSSLSGGGGVMRYSTSSSIHYGEKPLNRQPIMLKIKHVPITECESLALQRIRSFDFAKATPLDATKLLMEIKALLEEC